MDLNYFVLFNAGLLRGIACFFLGIAAYKVYRRYAGGLQGLKKVSLLELGLVFVLLVLVFARSGSNSPLDFLAPPVFFALVLIFALDRGLLARGLAKIRYVGAISYSIYLNQITLLIVLRYLFDSFGWSLDAYLYVYFPLLLVYSHFTYRYLERPAMQWGKRLLQKH